MKGILTDIAETKQSIKEINIKLDTHIIQMSSDITEIKTMLSEKTENKTTEIDKDVVMKILGVVTLFVIVIIMILSGDTSKATENAIKIISGG